MSKSGLIRKLVITAALILCAAATIYYCRFIYMPPFESLGVESLGQIRLGMRDVDVSLTFGRKPDCSTEEDGSYKKMSYQLGVNQLPLQGEPCRYEISLNKHSDGVYRVSRICFSREVSRLMPVYTTDMKYEWPRSLWSDSYSVPDSEKSIIETFGEPSSVSVNQDGTGKVINFNKHNAAFFIISGSVIQACVSNQLPIKFKNQYSGQ